MKALTTWMLSLFLMSMPLLSQADCQLSWCKKAKTEAEQAVCKSDVLRSADALMSLLYKQILANKNVLMGTRGTVKEEQQAFLKLREDVAYSEQALQNIYINRIAALQDVLKQHQPDI